MKYINAKDIIQWKDIDGYAGMYKINQLGQIYSAHRHRILRGHAVKNHSDVICDYRIGLHGNDNKIHVISLKRLMVYYYRPEYLQYKVTLSNPNKGCEIDNIVLYRTKSGRPVRIHRSIQCIETGKVYTSLTDAANNLSDNCYAKSTLSRCVDDMRATPYDGNHYIEI